MSHVVRFIRTSRRFWARFGGTWDEQCVFRIPQQEREKWVITDTSRWDFEKWP